MNLVEIKSALGVQSINLNQVVTAESVVTSWYKDWNNDSRIAILVHEDTLKSIKENASVSTLGINTQIRQGAKGEYTAKTIVLYKEADEVL